MMDEMIDLIAKNVGEMNDAERSASPAGVKPWGEMQAEDCVLSIGSKRSCGHGTLGCVNHHAPLLPIEPAGVGVETARTFKIGDMVRKRSGAWWEGRVVGFYSTEQTPDGVCVQLDKPMGPVQIYPASALASLKGD